MRVLRTEMYFSEDQIVGLNRRRTSHARNPGLGFVWLRADVPHEIHEHLLEQRWFDREERAASAFLDLAIRGYERRSTFSVADAHFGATYNPAIVQSVMNGDIVIENSPPEAVTFRSLLAKAPGVAIGTFGRHGSCRRYANAYAAHCAYRNRSVLFRNWCVEGSGEGTQ